MIRSVITAIVLVATLWFAAFAHAHKASDSYLTLHVAEKTISGQWDIALRDLDLVLNLDRNADAVIDWGEVRVRHTEIAAYALQHLALSQGNSRCVLSVKEHMIDAHSDGAYAVMKLSGSCPASGETLSVKYSLLFDVDAQHRGLLKLESNNANHSGVISAVFASNSTTQSFTLRQPNNIAQFATYVADGVKHIAIGFDHILFLVVLLLPAVLIRTGRTWTPVADWRSALVNILKIITAFTIAHSLTLSLAATGMVHLPSRVVESIIAVSVLLTAADNLWPFLPKKRWLVAFVFGLIHGFGFASVLLDLQLPASALFVSLLGFNLGVEIGQLLLVLLLMPLAYVSRQTQGYSSVALRAGSIVIAVISLGWFIERSLNLQLMPF